MNIDSSYKWSFISALIIHILLALFLLVHLTTNNNYVANASSVNIIKAVVINNNKSNKIATKNIEKEQNFNQNKEEPLPPPKLQQQSQLEELKQQQINAQRLIETKKKQEKELAVAKQKQLEEQKELKAKQELELKQAKARELMQKNMQEQLVSEQQEVAGIIGSTQNQAKIDKYKAQIIQSIAQYWIVPDNVGAGVYCQLLVHLAPGGQVLSVELIRSSGNEVLDRSAKTAVLKASPLPVPEDLSLFDGFRELRLTVRPEGVVASYN